MRVRALEEDAVGGERIDGRRSHGAVPVRGQVIRAERVDRDDDDRTGHRGRRASEPPAADRGQRCADRDEHQNERVAEGTRHYLFI